MKATDMAFNAWWQMLVARALEEDHDLEGTQHDYREYFDDGDTPAAALAMEQDSVVNDFARSFSNRKKG